MFCTLTDKTHTATREGIAYATKTCEITQGLELKNPSMWEEESAVVPNAATSESDEGCI